ncbi:hypothetical protein OQJ19_12435 [Fluoribacter gormanii]|uniref:Uncharacterized protein n=1 Tax=Fluoribacter gormanii TaxID=464 RepID=A0A377GLP8_9GAMM|nr:hypothetical protein [Fluoribacter gormanii]KTD01795.1 hypothetical protein Lgor_2172 [Fluoribacter gormanii]MCW8442964.1 hypothetical protein [Fluoribacter gormanii]MCW8471448.1 hypothetical protein [Fluoribacter gormanii]SIR20986.1 hypothetical protein SAMN05421777_10839 [Fluoribacter gormanii]STO25435.1 Uncharacterised protein [Fluoribacter gormanii]
MLKKIMMTTLSIINLSVFLPAYADGDMSCKVQVAVATPPIPFDQNVAFNVTSNELGLNKSLTLMGGKGPQFIDNIPCSPAPLTISATVYSTPGYTLQGSSIGQCVLKAGYVVLNGPENSVSVVFPYDFNCDK